MKLSIVLFYFCMVLGIANLLEIFTKFTLPFSLIIGLQIAVLFATVCEAAAWHIKHAFKDGTFKVAVNIKKEDLK